MLIDRKITLIATSKIMFKLKSIGIDASFKEIVTIPIEKLWKNSNFKINAKCDICNIEKNISYSMYNRNIEKYNLYCCSNKCSAFKNKLTCKEKYGDENYNNNIKAKQTCLERYGTESYNNKDKTKKTLKCIYGDENYNNREKYKNTCLERYGVDNIFKLEENLLKVKKTNLERYGIEDSRISLYVKEKRKKTVLEKYGVEYITQLDSVKNKIKNTSLERYGVDSPNKSDIIKNKKVISMLKKYGYISNSMTNECKEKLKNTNLERYGVEYPMQLMEFSEKQQKNSKKILYYNNNLYYQSSYEKHFLEYIDKLGLINDIKRGPTIKYNFAGKIKIHYPDFYFEKINLIIEIKSSYYYNLYLDKNTCKMNNSIDFGYNYLFIINKNYTAFNYILDSLQ